MTAVAVNSFDIDWTLKIVSAVTGSRAASIEMAEALDPQRPVRVDEGDGKTGYTLLCHQLRDTCSVGCDHGRSWVGRDRRQRGVERTHRRDERKGECRADRKSPPTERGRPATATPECMEADNSRRCRVLPDPVGQVAHAKPLLSEPLLLSATGTPAESGSALVRLPGTT